MLRRFVARLAARSNPPLAEWGIRELEPQAADRVLEIGCGPGTALTRLAACVSAGVIVGVDRSHAIAQLARQRLDRAGLQARGRVVQAGAEALPFGNAQFDGALAINTLNLLDDRARGLSEIRRTLRPAARFVMVLQPRWLKTRAEVEALARAEHAWLVRAGFDAAQPLVTNLRPVPALLIVGTKRERRSGAD